MLRVILQEFKKVFKSKINIILLVILFVSCGYMNYQPYHRSSIQNEYYNPTIMENGKPIEPLRLHQKFDEELSKKAGLVDKADYKKHYQEYARAFEKTYKNDEIDMDKAKLWYGEYAQEIIDKDKVWNIEEIDMMEYCPHYCEYEVDEEDNIKFGIPYKNDGQRLYLNTLYFDSHNIVDKLEDEEIIKSSANPFYALAHMEEFTYPDGKKNSEIFYMEEQPSEKDVKIATYLSEKMEHNDYSFHSTIANNMFISNTTSFTNVLALIVVAIIIANIFSSEVSLKTDQIIVPTKTGNVKLTIAKIACALVIGVGTILMVWFIALVSSLLTMPIHDLGSIVMNLGNTYVNVLNYVYTYQEIILGGLFVTVAVMIGMVAITLVLSYFTKNRFASIIVILILIFATTMIPFKDMFGIPVLDFIVPGKAMIFTLFFMFAPQWRVEAPYLVMGEQVIPIIYITIAMYLLIAILLFAAMILHSKKHIVNNR